MNRTELRELIVRAFSGNLTTFASERIADFLLDEYPKSNSVERIRVSMREIAGVLQDTADRDRYWKENDDESEWS